MVYPSAAPLDPSSNFASEKPLAILMTEDTANQPQEPCTSSSRAIQPLSKTPIYGAISMQYLGRVREKERIRKGQCYRVGGGGFVTVPVIRDES